MGMFMRYRDRVKTAIALILQLAHCHFQFDFMQGIRALSIDKDNTPKVSFSLSILTLPIWRRFIACVLDFNLFMTFQWNPATLEEVKNEDIDRVFQPFSPEHELQVPNDDSNRSVATSFKCPHHSWILPSLLTLSAPTMCRWSGKYENTVYAKIPR